MGTHPIFESDFDCLTDMSSGLKPPSKLMPPARKEENEASGGFVVGDRVLAAGKKGKVTFLGETEFASGQWAGIILDDPVGKNNGEVAGKRYFQTKDKHGVFVRPTKLEAETSTPSTPKLSRVGSSIS